MAIWHHQKHGPQGPSVVITTQTAYPMSKRHFPMAQKRILGSTMQHWWTYGMSSLRRTINNAETMQWSGTPNHYLTICNKSTHFVWQSCSCSQLKCRLSKTIPTKVTDFLKFINHWTGAVLLLLLHIPMWMESKHMQGINIMEMDISLCWFITRYETEGLNFFASKREHRKGLNNIVDLWRDFNIGECL